MDHIVRCMLDVDSNDYGDHLQHTSYIETDDYPDHHHQQLQQQKQQQQQQQQQQQEKQPKQTEDRPHVWRMHSQSERKYQLFPKDKQQPAALSTGKGIDPEQAYALAMGASTSGNSSASASASEKQSDKTQSGSGLRLRMKEHSLVRRRKISVPDLGPMTTVQEVAMDSPTIPGRPPLHERSISAPGNSWRQHHLVDCMIQPAYDDIPEQSVYMSYNDLVASPIDVPRCSSAQAVLSPTVSAMAHSHSLSHSLSYSPRAASPSIPARQPLSPKVLAPLVIPPLHSQSQTSLHAYSQSLHGHGHSQASSSRHYHQTSSSLSSTFNVLRTSASATSSLYAQSQYHSQNQSQSYGQSHQTYNGRFRSSTAPVDNMLRSARSDESPRSRTPFTPYTPLSAASASTASTLPTPVSATTTDSNFTISASKEGPSGSSPTACEPLEPRSTTPSLIKMSTMPTAATIFGHRRGQSDIGSIMERGRPRKRSTSREGSASAAISAMVTAGATGAAACKGKDTTDASPAPPACANAGAAATATASVASVSADAAAATPAAAGSAAPSLKHSASKTGLKNAAERRAFEMLPRGCKASEAPAYLTGSDIAALATQALQQAARFEVLSREDVDSLSRELRSLDERCEYLRRTYTSLRAGRRNLHGRICQYLRSPRVAKFSHDSMLKQEEALAELDTSIDDWVTKLEQADNRRTRVRQKLLEHVAAAVTLPLTSSLAAVAVAAAGIVPAAAVTSALASANAAATASATVAGVSESLQLAMGINPAAPAPASASAGASGGAANTSASSSKYASQQAMSTPPRSPTKTAFQPTATPMPASASAAAYAAASIISPVAASSPQRPIVAQVPSTILEQPLVEEAMATIAKSEAAAAAAAAKSGSRPAPISTAADAAVADTPLSPASTLDGLSSRRVDVESIRIYAGDDVYALLADVESQITQMGGAPVAVAQTARLTEQQRRELHRARSEELLSGGHSGSKRSTPTPPASPGLSGSGSSSSGGSKTTAATSSSSSGASSPTDDEPEIFLTSAVFRPGRSTLVM